MWVTSVQRVLHWPISQQAHDWECASRRIQLLIIFIRETSAALHIRVLPASSFLISLSVSPPLWSCFSPASLSSFFLFFLRPLYLSRSVPPSSRLLDGLSTTAGVVFLNRRVHQQPKNNCAASLWKATSLAVKEVLTSPKMHKFLPLSSCFALSFFYLLHKYRYRNSQQG